MNKRHRLIKLHQSVQENATSIEWTLSCGRQEILFDPIEDQDDETHQTVPESPADVTTAFEGISNSPRTITQSVKMKSPPQNDAAVQSIVSSDEGDEPMSSNKASPATPSKLKLNTSPVRTPFLPLSALPRTKLDLNNRMSNNDEENIPSQQAIKSSPSKSSGSSIIAAFKASPIPLFDPNSIHLAGRPGIRNLGNTCYINAVLQSLFSLKQLMLQLEPITQVKSTMPTITKSLVLLHKESKETSERYISIESFREAVGYHNKIFRSAQQQDAHEFLTYLLDRINEEWCMLSPGTPPDASCISPIRSLCTIEVTHYRTCKSCGDQKSNSEKESVLSLKIGNCTPALKHAEVSVSSLLDLYLQDEEIEYTCESCHQKTGATVSHRVTCLPKFLMVHIARFKFDGVRLQKHRRAIQFTPELRLESRTTKSDTPSIDAKLYRLVSVVTHRGEEPTSGHYIAFAHHTDTPIEWVKIDDRHVYKIGPFSQLDTKMEREEHYLHFYIRQDTV
eukprot:TRINITY_DN7485_c5_g1_i1.p1 TRINITY_DN7485_c5_g1~~TRINITY_DN7485_c5_g1_i1.p1  ORF type:complete len:589 (-),score=132.94 TRINITY_DN7485_c5_g1_i1:100-1617(-)